MDLINKYLITDRCCLCTDIRTGGLLLGCFEITASVVIILVNLGHPDLRYAEVFILPVLTLILSSSFVYGIISNKSKFLLPEVCVNLISFGIFLIAGAIFTVITCGIALLIFAPLGAIFWNFTAVRYSLYLKINDENMHHPGAVYYASEVSPS